MKKLLDLKSNNFRKVSWKLSCLAPLIKSSWPAELSRFKSIFLKISTISWALNLVARKTLKIASLEMGWGSVNDWGEVDKSIRENVIDNLDLAFKNPELGGGWRVFFKSNAALETLAAEVFFWTDPAWKWPPTTFVCFFLVFSL